MAAFEVRRIVTGHDASGKSIVVADGPAPQPHDRAMFAEIWNTTGAPARITPTETHEPNERPLTIGPSPRGSIIRVVEMPPGHRSAMHRTRTIDYGIVLAGEPSLVLEDSETLLHVGDIVVQRGTNHAWENRGAAPARMAFILIDGVFAPELERSVRDMVLVP